MIFKKPEKTARVQITVRPTKKELAMAAIKVVRDNVPESPEVQDALTWAMKALEDAEPIEYKEENEALKRKLANAGNEMIIRFKVLVDQLQDTFDQACQCIEIEQAKDRAVKMDEALRQVVEKLSGNWRL